MPESPTSHRLQPSKSTVVLLGVGLLLIIIYFVLEARDLVGPPTEGGGGLILLVGYFLVAAGVIKRIVDFVRRR